ncbi:Putative nitrilase/cyanide hydratase [Helicobacter sp. NHP19-012]|uniref:Nitrilase/cyanide hydratase n=1 Tax=Helicobacter gastrofelis TaxID=2849642 RepID=A0ABM7SK45_9HELI|nr:carbon-nitrogen hydrolase family protein [Helicobacter sp. NHP19-012]BCZ18510.1 Putative nitrilase/cyanide hydratase [Helicobacter sp. NHP19-012]
MHLFLLQMASFEWEFIQKSVRQMPPNAVVVLPEYAATPFFLELLSLAPEKIDSHSQARLEQLQLLSAKHQITFSVPLVLLKEQGLLKHIALISPQDTQFYSQQRLVNFEHWGEASFFANPQPTAFKTPPILEIEGIKIAPLFGYELHFDRLWVALQEAGVEVVLVSTASTFESFERWRCVLRSRAFCNSMLVARANRIGMVRENQNIPWRFYGDSLIALPNGNIASSLEGDLGVLHLEVHKAYLQAWAKEWGFRPPN